MGQGIFSGSGLQVVELPSTLREIGHGTFQNCKNLQSVKFPSGLKRICCSAFRECTIESIIFPPALEEIQRGAFYRNKLTRISFQANDTLREIGEYAFGHNHGIEHTQVVFPKSAHVSERVFDTCEYFEPGEKMVAMRF